jgi:NADH dehydrogenase FAD-containing subunit
MLSSLFSCGNKASSSPDKTVLVIGGGIAGLSAIYGLRQIDKEVKIILVEPKEYCEILWASYRSPFEEWVAKGSLIRLDLYCKEYNVEWIQATVTKLSKTTVTCTLLDKTTVQTIDFDVCTVATGAASHWPAMGRGLPESAEAATIKNRLDTMSAEGRRLLESKSVAIIGGGLIGTELAGDIAGYAKKVGKTTPTVTLIHSTAQLCPIMSPPAAAKLRQKLEGLGVKVILNEMATEENGKLVLQNSKHEVESEIVIKTIGFVAINSFMKDEFADALDDKGWIRTDEYFSVSGSDGKLFAYGDCSSSLPNSGNMYMANAKVLATNLKAALTNNEDGQVKFEIPFAVYATTVGPKQGVFYSSAFWTQYLVPWIKNKTMFFMSPRVKLGVKKEMTLAD